MFCQVMLKSQFPIEMNNVDRARDDVNYYNRKEGGWNDQNDLDTIQDFDRLQEYLFGDLTDLNTPPSVNEIEPSFLADLNNPGQHVCMTDPMFFDDVEEPLDLSMKQPYFLADLNDLGQHVCMADPMFFDDVEALDLTMKPKFYGDTHIHEDMKYTVKPSTPETSTPENIDDAAEPSRHFTRKILAVQEKDEIVMRRWPVGKYDPGNTMTMDRAVYRLCEHDKSKTAHIINHAFPYVNICIANKPFLGPRPDNVFFIVPFQFRQLVTGQWMVSLRRMNFRARNQPLKIIVKNSGYEEPEKDVYKRMKTKEYIANIMPHPAADIHEVGSKFVCSICNKKLYTRDCLDMHYQLIHDKVECKKCGELIEFDDATIRIHNRKCFTGFKDRRRSNVLIQTIFKLIL